MFTIPNYKITKQIYESINSLIYRAIKLDDNKSIILKILKEDYPTADELIFYRQEYDIIKYLAEIDGVIDVYNLDKYNNTLVICLEDFGGESLKDCLIKYHFDIDKLLKIAIQATEILEQIHNYGIIHKDINSSNLVFNPDTSTLKFIDFGISTQLSQQIMSLKNPDGLEGTLAYISPEQTGRMNRALDYRTDFYSLGITLYELFTKQLPFSSSDAVELVHCHIAKQPVTPAKLQNLPLAISDIIMKLLEKMPEDRYQSTWGIKADLQKCQQQLTETGTIEIFSTGQQDFSERFQVSQKLYGREQEIKILLNAFDRVVNRSLLPSNDRIAEMMLVVGSSGAGKSVLIKEIYKSLVTFISGKFNQFQKNVPYSGIVSAFNELVQQLLTKDEAQIQQWRDKLLTALGNNGQIIIDVIPAIELIIGSQPPVPLMEPKKSKNRFNLVFQNFIQVFCEPTHPLILFLDNLQWADLASLQLLEMIMISQDTNAIFVIGAFRDNEVNSEHPITTLLENLYNENIVVNQINLTSLQLNHVNQLIADTLYQDEKITLALADLVMQKTGGNPFFVNQFLHTLYEEKLLTFVPPSAYSKASWQWDMEQIKAIDITDNVVELMIAKLKKLPTKSQHILCLAACMGNYFNLQILSTVYTKIHLSSTGITFKDILPILTEGFILPTSEPEIDAESPFIINNFKFLHDRVQQAAYTLIVDKKNVHLQIGLLLLETDVQENIFDIVEHFNLGLVQDSKLKNKVAELNLIASRKSKKATAYVVAEQYLTIGEANLDGDYWQEHYELAFNIYLEKSEIEYLNGNFEQSEASAKLILKHAKSPIDKVEAYKILVVQYTMQGQYAKAIQTGQEALLCLDVDLPSINLAGAFEKEILMAKINLGNRDISSLLNQTEVTDKQISITAKLLRYIAIPAYFYDQELWFLLTMKNVNLCLKHGYVQETPSILCAYGIILGSIYHEYKIAYEFTNVAIEISNKFNDNKCQAYTMTSGFLLPWVKHIKHTRTISDEAQQAGLESGDLQYMGYLSTLQVFNSFYQGRSLKHIVSRIYKGLSFNRKAKNQFSTDLLLGIQTFLFNLTGFTESKTDFYNEEMTEEQYLEQHKNHKSILCYCFILKTQVSYLYGKPKEALQYAIKAEKLINSILGVVTVVDNNFYYSLCMTTLYLQAPKEEQTQYWQKLTENQQQMRVWANNCEDNFLHKYLLIEAEIARITGKDSEALDLYAQAITNAKKHKFIQDEALANELIASFWFAKGYNQYANTHLREAHYAYQKWRATAKVKDLEDRYPQLLANKTLIPTNNSVLTSTKMTASHWLDLSSVVKASHAMSEEIMLAKLLKKMMNIIIENAGANRGFIILPQQNNWFIEAEIQLDNLIVKVLQSIPVNSYKQISVNIINYVIRTGKNVVLNNNDHKFTSDSYINKYHPKSILCMPLSNQGILKGILYLENNQLNDVFTSERIEVLNLLSSQIMISIENAQLYQNLEQKVNERTIKLQTTLEDLRAAQSQLIHSEKLAALGQLIAGIAHEVNTPLGAIRASIDNALASFNAVTSNLPQLSEFISVANRLQLFMLLLEKAKSSTNSLTSKEKRAAKRKLRQTFGEIEHSSTLADLLVYMKITEDCTDLLPLLKDEQAIDVVKMARNFISIYNNSTNINLAVNKASKVIFALRKFAHQDTSGEKSPLDIIDSIDTVLTLYHNQIKQGTEIIKNYQQPISLVKCYVDEIQQVWTNIIHNALQAMENKGVLTIKVVESKGQVTVSFTDNGCGIPVEIQERIFEPFFTTKIRGEGSGIGLDIVKKIIDKHKGKIEIESSEGTTFKITLPIEG
ncbi:AAA family ATPase [Candidatus Halobeggiatoa sp. HSG11]|nr:AAA family ATPase [Candidatus Halobeggiatoa sp. HSG11]